PMVMDAVFNPVGHGNPKLTASVSLAIDRPPPASPLFPYTTLFRSQTPPGPAGSRTAPGPSRGEGSRGGGGSPGVPPGRPATSATDRKSTRLNSSHDQISYAVFCLKKKSPGLSP